MIPIDGNGLGRWDGSSSSVAPAPSPVSPPAVSPHVVVPSRTSVFIYSTELLKLRPAAEWFPPDDLSADAASPNEQGSVVELTKPQTRHLLDCLTRSDPMVSIEGCQFIWFTGVKSKHPAGPEILLVLKWQAPSANVASPLYEMHLHFDGQPKEATGLLYPGSISSCKLVKAAMVNGAYQRDEEDYKHKDTNVWNSMPGWGQYAPGILKRLHAHPEIKKLIQREDSYKKKGGTAAPFGIWAQPSAAASSSSASSAP